MPPPLKTLIEKTGKEFDYNFPSSSDFCGCLDKGPCPWPDNQKKIKSFLSRAQTEAFEVGVRAAMKKLEMLPVPRPLKEEMFLGYNLAVKHAKSSLETLLSNK